MIERLFYSFLPYALASSGALASELAGSLAVFTDGFMQLGSFVFWSTATLSGSILAGSLAALLPAALLGWLLSRWVRRSGSNAFIVALAINASARAVCDSLSLLFWGRQGELIDTRFPGLSREGGQLFLGRLFSNPLFYLSLLALATLALFLYRSMWGLRLRAAGTSEKALEERGLKAGPLRDLSWALCAAFAALAGSILALRLEAFSPGAAGGRGWIALAIIFMGQRRLTGVLVASLVFAIAELMAIELDMIPALPPAFMQAAPFLLALILYALQSKFKERECFVSQRKAASLPDRKG